MAMGVALVTEAPAIGVDTDEDLRRANADWTAFEERTR
jgi:CMP-2-keto-3-deoxyoctulosonic acid synthetase